MANVIETPWGGHPAAPEEVDALIARMKTGDRVVYHTGNLVNDRDKPGELAQRIGAMADRFYHHGTPPAFSWADDRAMDGARRGHLLQRRVGGGQFDYIFIKGKTAGRIA